MRILPNPTDQAGKSLSKEQDPERGLSRAGIDEVVLLMMTQKEMDKRLTSPFKLGADMDIAVGLVGAGTGARGVTQPISICFHGPKEFLAASALP